MTASHKTLYVDGRPVGDVLVTGDIETDIAAVKSTIRAAGLERPASSVDALMQQAMSFATTATFIYSAKLSKKPWDQFAVSPFVVNSVFSIELYLKAIAKIFGKELHGHRLKTELFDNLPVAAVHAIDSLTLEYRNDKGKDAPSDIRTVLDTLNNAFVAWRYAHEGKDTPYFKVSDSIAVLDILDAACRDSRKA